MAEIVRNLTPYIAVLSGLLSLGALGFVLRLTRVIHTSQKEQTKIIELRLESAREELLRTEKWAERERERLNRENEKLSVDLKNALDGA
jgi:hypothetical protein